MKVWTIKQAGGRDQLIQEDRPQAKAQEGQLLIKVKAFGINRTEIRTRENKNLKPPYPVLGVELAGEVIENNSDRQDIKVGSRVMGLVNEGSYAEYAVMPADMAMIIPNNLSYVEAAGVPEVFLTAYQTMYWLGELQEEQTILVHAAASGVGTSAVQLARQLSNAKIIATASQKEKLNKVQELGADHLINYKEEDIAQRVEEITDGKGVDVILDFVGASYWEINMKSIATDGRWVLIGTLGGSEVESVNLFQLMLKRIHLKGTLLTPRTNDYKAKLSQEFSEKALPLMAEGKISPIIYKEVDFDNLPQAHEIMENNENIGKIIVKV